MSVKSRLFYARIASLTWRAAKSFVIAPSPLQNAITIRYVSNFGLSAGNRKRGRSLRTKNVVKNQSGPTYSLIVFTEIYVAPTSSWWRVPFSMIWNASCTAAWYRFKIVVAFALLTRANFVAMRGKSPSVAKYFCASFLAGIMKDHIRWPKIRISPILFDRSLWNFYVYFCCQRTVWKYFASSTTCRMILPLIFQIFDTDLGAKVVGILQRKFLTVKSWAYVWSEMQVRLILSNIQLVSSVASPVSERF